MPDEREALKASPGYIYSSKDSPIKASTIYSTQFLGLNSNFGAWPVSKYGEDVIIGFVDSGIWLESKSFNDNGMSGIPSRWNGKESAKMVPNSTPHCAIRNLSGLGSLRRAYIR